ncbi:MAG TPA: response regulator transcription factor [Chloroflexota bacterium]|nr:response regulator transcription factor [Chloroflexota bacterium]
MTVAERRRILVVDDEEAIVDGLCRLLRQEGYEPLAARTGQEALDQVGRPEGVRPALMLLDVMLPDVDGYEVCRRVRQLPGYTPILMLTARGDLVDKLVGLGVGADAYVAKPFEPRELLAQVRAILRLVEQQEAARRGEPAPPVRHGPITFWEAQHRVEVDGAPRELTPKEFELLRLFLHHPGQVFGRETLLREVWGYDFLGDSRTVDVHIQRLRARIEPEPETPRLIRTVRGFGYRLALQSELGRDGSRP